MTTGMGSEDRAGRPEEAELFRFEAPSARGKFVVIGPNDLTPDEAAEFTSKVGRIVTAMFADYNPPCPDCGHPESNHGPTGNPAAGCWAEACATRVKGKSGTKCHRGRPFDPATTEPKEPE